MKTRYLSILPAFVCFASLSFVGTARAAVIFAMQDPTPTEAEVSNTDVLAAVNLGENQGSGPGTATAVNVNGVNFVPLTTALPGTSTSTPINESFGTSQGQVQILTTARGFTSFRASDFDANGSSDLPSPLDALYDPIVVGNDGGTGVDIEFNFSSLDLGTRYRFQLFMASSNQTNRIVDVLQDGSILLATYDNTVPHGEIITLEWLADQPTEQIILRGNILGSGVPIVSGFSLSLPVVPEPATGTTMMISALALPLTRSRRRSRKARAT